MQTTIGAIRLATVGRLASGGLIFGLIISGAGCMHSELADTNPNFSVIQEKDIPAPRDFQFDKDRSFTYTPYRDPKGVGYFRNTTLYYYGDQQVGKLVPWYQEQMKADGWKFREARDDQDKRCLVFTKTNETAFIQLYREFDARKDRYFTFVQAEVHPTRTEEMASEDLLNSPILPQRATGAADGEAALDDVSPVDDEIEARTAGGAEESSIIMDSPRGARDARVSGASSITRQTSAAPNRRTPSPGAPSRAIPLQAAPPGEEANKQVVNEEVGVENSEEHGEDFPAEDDGTED